MKNLKDLKDDGYEDYFNSFDEDLSESFEDEESGHLSGKKMKRGKKGRDDWDFEDDRKKSSDRAKKRARKEKLNMNKNY